jgi:hypothetical protein
MSATPTTSAPNLMFSHMGFACSDIVKMEDFYTRVLGSPSPTVAR